MSSLRASWTPLGSPSIRTRLLRSESWGIRTDTLYCSLIRLTVERVWKCMHFWWCDRHLGNSRNSSLELYKGCSRTFWKGVHAVIWRKSLGKICPLTFNLIDTHSSISHKIKTTDCFSECGPRLCWKDTWPGVNSSSMPNQTAPNLTLCGFCFCPAAKRRFTSSKTFGSTGGIFYTASIRQVQSAEFEKQRVPKSI